MSKTDDLIAWPIRCSTCGEGEVSPLARPGRTACYKNMAALPIPDDLAIPTCRACGAEWIDRPTAEAVDAALEHGVSGTPKAARRYRPAAARREPRHATAPREAPRPFTRLSLEDPFRSQPSERHVGELSAPARQRSETPSARDGRVLRACRMTTTRSRRAARSLAQLPAPVKPRIRMLGPDDQERLEAFLRPGVDSSIFLLSNSRRAGLVDRGQHFEGTYLAAFEGGRIAGALAHGRPASSRRRRQPSRRTPSSIRDRSSGGCRRPCRPPSGRSSEPSRAGV